VRWVPSCLDVPAMFGLRGFETFKGTRLRVVEGCGKDGHGVVREVTYWLDENGDLISRYDPIDEVAGDTAGNVSDYARVP
jgi:hypothetical protein